MSLLSEQLQTTGFATRVLIREEEAKLLLSKFSSLGCDPDASFFATSVHADRATAKEAAALVHASLRRPLELILPDYDPFIAGFIVKGPGGSSVDYHQDLTYTDERLHRCIIAWIPLVDVNDDTGAMAVISGSHRFTNHIRPSTLKTLPTAFWQRQFAQHGRAVPLSAGSVMLYDAALIHGSAANKSKRPRVVAAIAYAPRGSALVHFKTDGRRLRGYRVGRDFFEEQTIFDEPLSGEPLPPWTRATKRSDFRKALRTMVGRPETGPMSVV